MRKTANFEKIYIPLFHYSHHLIQSFLKKMDGFLDLTKSYCYVKDPVDVYRAVEIRSVQNADYEICELDGSKISTVKITETYPIASFEELSHPPPDLIKLMMVNLPGILNTLKYRFLKDLIYTSVGPILVAVNPFKWIPGIYDENVMMKYFREETDLTTDPHVFAIANEAFKGLQFKRNQSLIISGESGAGKTETTKQCCKYSLISPLNSF